MLVPKSQFLFFFVCVLSTVSNIQVLAGRRARAVALAGQAANGASPPISTPPAFWPPLAFVPDSQLEAKQLLATKLEPETVNVVYQVLSEHFGGHLAEKEAQLDEAKRQAFNESSFLNEQLDEAKRQAFNESSFLNEQLQAVSAQLAEKEAALEEMRKVLPPPVPSKVPAEALSYLTSLGLVNADGTLALPHNDDPKPQEQGGFVEQAGEILNGVVQQLTGTPADQPATDSAGPSTPVEQPATVSAGASIPVEQPAAVNAVASIPVEQPATVSAGASPPVEQPATVSAGASPPVGQPATVSAGGSPPVGQPATVSAGASPPVGEASEANRTFTEHLSTMDQVLAAEKAESEATEITSHSEPSSVEQSDESSNSEEGVDAGAPPAADGAPAAASAEAIGGNILFAAFLIVTFGVPCGLYFSSTQLQRQHRPKEESPTKVSIRVDGSTSEIQVEGTSPAEALNSLQEQGIVSPFRKSIKSPIKPQEPEEDPPMSKKKEYSLLNSFIPGVAKSGKGC
ncbi:hypothetical protein CYMTET_27772 [Cymbomonas tetramitiformis]|uniref:Uncharacterized protein n=1 Tax=Cymbomonas tetramitiformis TaxID=36881 RepID=A0AAE0KWV3_9CHLO|nr:hypothetical protein CYMTET_27772 [Cymbomonas tetramitiformis]